MPFYQRSVDHLPTTAHYQIYADPFTVPNPANFLPSPTVPGERATLLEHIIADDNANITVRPQ